MVRRSAWVVAVVGACGAAAWCFEGCTSSGTSPPAVDGGPSEDSAAPDATGPDTGPGSILR